MAGVKEVRERVMGEVRGLVVNRVAERTIWTIAIIQERYDSDFDKDREVAMIKSNKIWDIFRKLRICWQILCEYKRERHLT